MLFKFDDDVFQYVLKKQLSESQYSFLSKQGIRNPLDIFLLRPKRYDVRSYDIKLSDLVVGEQRALIGKIRSISKKKIRNNLVVYNAMLHTNFDQIPIVWFNQQYLIQTLKKDPFVVVVGTLEDSSFSVSFKVAEIEIVYKFSDALQGKPCPVYPDIRGISNQKLRAIIRECLDKYPQHLVDVLPDSIRQDQSLLSAYDAVKQFHFPESQQQVKQATDRFTFDELFEYLYPRRHRHFMTHTEQAGIVLSVDQSFIDGYFKQLPYSLTGAQQRVWDHIMDDLGQHKCVYRLIQGDVGSGKTDVAILSLLAAYGSGYKGAILVPTEILAQQHYYKCMDRLSNLGVEVMLLKGKLSKKKKQVIYDRLASEDPLIVIGTHALIQDRVSIHKLAVVVIDEQHRFGVFQRQSLLEKSDRVPHCLFMTATPIPRSLMLTHYGDLDHDVIDELPPGRKSAKTYYAKLNRMVQIYEFIRLELQHGRQAYVVFPLIDESEHLDLANAVQGYETISEYFSDKKVGLLHGKMSDDEKNTIMDQFKANDTHILVSTTVIEVGVDVPNASVMVIMNAERFGLSQLHQLRGRVGRGADQAHCFLVADAKSPESKQRIKAMLDTTNGFKLAEEDLKIRGPGNLLGTQQSGELVFSFANVMDQRRVQRVVDICDGVIQHPEQYPELMAYFEMGPMMMAKQLN